MKFSYMMKNVNKTKTKHNIHEFCLSIIKYHLCNRIKTVQTCKEFNKKGFIMWKTSKWVSCKISWKYSKTRMSVSWQFNHNTRYLLDFSIIFQLSVLNNHFDYLAIQLIHLKSVWLCAALMIQKTQQKFPLIVR